MPLPEAFDLPVPLTAAHVVQGFACGAFPLDEYLTKHALNNQRNRSARTYVAARQGRVVGYYTLAAGSVLPEEAPTRIVRGLAKHPVPIVLLARLAVDQPEKGQGLGRALLKDALLRCLQVSDLVGCRAVLVHAKDESARAFYSKFGFEPSPTHALHLYLLMKDVEAAVGPATTS